MAGKHQIWSSNKKTRQKANRCWRRQNKERLRDEPLAADETAAGDAPNAEALKAGPLVYATGGPDGATGGTAADGTRLGPLLDQAIRKGKHVTVEEFAAMVGRWERRTPGEFAEIMSHLPAASRDEAYHRFQAMPLEYFLGLDLDAQARFVTWLRSSTGSGS